MEIWKKNLKQLIVGVGKEKQRRLVYQVEPELLKVAKLHSKFFLDRYHEEEGRHWTQQEERNTYVGLVGQKAFDLTLQQFGVPADRNDPTIDWRKKKDYDFKIPQLGTIEVKCFDHWCRKVLIKVAEFHKNDYYVIFQFKDEEPSILYLIGWLTGEQVENLPISKKEETKYTPYEDAYITDFIDLELPYDFIEKLEQLSETMW